MGLHKKYHREAIYVVLLLSSLTTLHGVSSVTAYHNSSATTNQIGLDDQGTTTYTIPFSSHVIVRFDNFNQTHFINWTFSTANNVKLTVWALSSTHYAKWVANQLFTPIVLSAGTVTVDSGTFIPPSISPGTWYIVYRHVDSGNTANAEALLATEGDYAPIVVKNVTVNFSDTSQNGYNDTISGTFDLDYPYAENTGEVTVDIVFSIFTFNNGWYIDSDNIFQSYNQRLQISGSDPDVFSYSLTLNFTDYVPNYLFSLNIDPSGVWHAPSFIIHPLLPNAELYRNFTNSKLQHVNCDIPVIVNPTIETYDNNLDGFDDSISTVIEYTRAPFYSASALDTLVNYKVYSALGVLLHEENATFSASEQPKLTHHITDIILDEEIYLNISITLVPYDYYTHSVLTGLMGTNAKVNPFINTFQVDSVKASTPTSNSISATIDIDIHYPILTEDVILRVELLSSVLAVLDMQERSLQITSAGSSDTEVFTFDNLANDIYILNVTLIQNSKIVDSRSHIDITFLDQGVSTTTDYVPTTIQDYTTTISITDRKSEAALSNMILISAFSLIIVTFIIKRRVQSV